MKIIGSNLNNIPWEDKPAGSKDVIWRYSKNPIINRYDSKNTNSIFNSAVIPYKDGFAGVFRCDTMAVDMRIKAGFSKDGFNFKINDDYIKFLAHDNKTLHFSEYQYDPRVVKIDDTYYISWCNGYHGPTIGLGYTKDFKKFHQLENAFLPYNRNGVLFPRKINNKYLMLSRPSDTGHTAFGDIFLSESPDLVYWGRHRYVMGVSDDNNSAWQSLKIGPGPAPIETDMGWLLIYHGVIRTCNGYRYSFGAALLDLKDPSKVIARSRKYLMSPAMIYEQAGDVPNVVFPCAALTDAATGRIAIYYGCADTVTGLCFTTIDEIISWLLDKDNNMIGYTEQ